MSSLMNKVKEALHSDKDKDKQHHEQQQQQQQQSKDSGHSKSHPRSEAEREREREQQQAYEHRQNEPYTTSENYGYGAGQQGGTIGTTGPTGTTGGVYDDRPGANRGARGPASSTDGPHSSNMANKMDPRVDSDRDYSRNMGMNPDRSATTGQQQYPAGSQGYGTQGTGGGVLGGSRTDPHHDPDFESARDEPRTSAFGTGGRHTAGGGGGGVYGDTRGAADPTGPAPHTAGPHKSDMMNKMDPRVDSDRDGSKTYMGDKTYPERQ